MEKINGWKNEFSEKEIALVIKYTRQLRAWKHFRAVFPLVLYKFFNASTDEDFFETAKDLVRYRTTPEEHFGLDKYTEEAEKYYSNSKKEMHLYLSQYVIWL